MKLFKPLFLMFVMVITSQSVRAQLVIEITSGADQLLPIAVVPFEYSGANPLPEDIAQIVESDLLRSGVFETIPRASMLSEPSSSDNVFYRDWRILKAEYILVGAVLNASNGNYQVAFELLNVNTQQRVGNKEVISVTPSSFRDAAHFISDKVYQALTGIKGAFSTRILYVTAEGDRSAPNYKLQVADADGHRAQVIVESKEPILSPSWSRNGRFITYVMFRDRRPNIFIQELATGKRSKVAQYKGLNGAPAWSPDGKKLALVLSKDNNPEVYVLDIATQKLDRMTNHYAIDTEPSWEPDGKGIIFTSDRGGNPQIYRLDVKSKEVERVTFEGDSNTRARMTPDGRYLVTVQKDSGNYHIALQDMKNGRVTILTQTYLDESPSIAPNGSMVMYATTEGNKGILSVVSVDGLVKYKLPSSNGDVREPAWSPYFK
ncbi:Tol-Pal system beta propeller repeat protein TolB [Marinomonas mediterranea]|jgi:tol-pal system beta propeller repeat protein TolB|uniref:Tol-Pal system protein TolB n=1 Tax=Marinomonas mediterranea (strain ATCC 700492 / JCM 21426 / NBRC 103028 / MMB-1) TaxID=717774 RepID=F2K2U0_MARM1|nr:Tol-Pal system beta propeller repeat protein TolB [Marinomonas mediterranea]ADZ91223.1 Protein tolB [Marinomonas mediterranea MMB-1]WCN09198.1 Tol-Pal system protein TolB [Marinomonas mediterranea]WCN17349.1 Tol-Pal system protein TolB [Marinomonas mediterranea MMB-1]